MTPTSDDPAKRERQMSNLQPGQHVGNLVPGAGQAARAADTLRHGAYSRRLTENVEEEVSELMDALADTAPVRAADGGLPCHDVIAVEALARTLRRWRAVEAWLDLHGILDERTGEPKPAAKLAGDLHGRLVRGLEGMGMTPKARAALGLDLARTLQADPSAVLSDPDRGRRAAGMRALGLTVDADAEEEVPGV